MRYHLSDIQQHQLFSEILDNLNAKAMQKKWYPLVQELLMERKKGMIERGHDLVQSMQNRIFINKKGAESQERERRLQNEVDLLLSKGTVCERHTQSLPLLYAEYGAGSFWNAYRERLVTLLLSSDISYIFEVLSFWFDESLKFFGEEPYIAQT